jgi:hypothetical protein
LKECHELHTNTLFLTERRGFVVKELVIMEEDQRKEIEEIINQFKCQRDFLCCKRDFEDLCKAEDIGLETFLKCLDEDPRSCPVSVPFGYGYLCECPLRMYICKKLKK